MKFKKDDRIVFRHNFPDGVSDGVERYICGVVFTALDEESGFMDVLFDDEDGGQQYRFVTPYDVRYNVSTLLQELVDI